MCNTAGQVEHGELIVSADMQGFVNHLHACGLDKQQILRRIFAREGYRVPGRQIPSRGFTAHGEPHRAPGWSDED